MTIGDRTLRYDPATYFVMSVDRPAVGAVCASDDGDPYLAVSLSLEPAILAELLADLPNHGESHAVGAGILVAPVSDDLLDAWVRMLRLMERPEEIPLLRRSL